jgi:hypothetical protein
MSDETKEREHANGTRTEPIMFFNSKNGNGPYFHACGGLAAVRDWLNRQITIGGVTAVERSLVERMLDDISEQDVADAAYNGIIPPRGDRP